MFIEEHTSVCALQISSASNCTDFQSRRLGITYRTQQGDIKHCHTVSSSHTRCFVIINITVVFIVSCLFITSSKKVIFSLTFCMSCLSVCFT